MEPRQQRGLAIANRCYIGQQNGFWVVPSQSGQGRYRVLDGDRPTCTCPDYESRGEKCKHIYAVEYIVGDGDTVGLQAAIVVVSAENADAGSDVRLLPSRVDYTGATQMGQAYDSLLQSRGQNALDASGLSYGNATDLANLSQSNTTTIAANEAAQAKANAEATASRGRIISGIGNLALQGGSYYGGFGGLSLRNWLWARRAEGPSVSRPIMHCPTRPSTLRWTGSITISRDIARPRQVSSPPRPAHAARAHRSRRGPTPPP